MTIRTLTSLQHPLVKHLVHLRQNHDYRDDHRSVVIVGEKEVREIGAKTPVKTLFVLNESMIPEGIDAKDVYVVNEEILFKTSGMRTPEGVLAEVEMPPSNPLQGFDRIVVLDEVSDPGNLGTILRTALALGWQGAFVIDGSCDPYNDKALRAARGATFRLPIGRGSWSDLSKIIETNQLDAYAADLKGMPISEVKSKKIALVLGNEAHGLSEHATSACKKVTIPMEGPMESLNVSVAGGILMFGLKGA